MAEELINTRFYNDPNLVSYWRMEGNSNDSKGTNHGTDTNVTYGTGYGKFGQGASLNGSSSRISISDATSLKPASSYTISAWINLNAATNNSTIFSTLTWPTTYGFQFYISSSTSKIKLYHSLNVSPYATEVGGNTTLSLNTWHHVVGVWDGTSLYVYVNGSIDCTPVSATSHRATVTQYPSIGVAQTAAASWGDWFQGSLDDIAIFSRALSASEVSDLYIRTKSKYTSGKNAGPGTIVKNDDSSLGTDLVAWKKFQTMLMKSVNGGTIFSKEVVSTYPLVYTANAAYAGGVLAPNGDIHLVPCFATVGQKVSASGVVSTYSLVYTANDAYPGGVLALNGDIHFVPLYASVGQKISSSGVVSTYSLVYTTSALGSGGVLAANGDIHFIPYSAARGQKINSSGVVSTYSLVYTVASAYGGGVLAPNGDIHFIPRSAAVGQKISSSGVVSTYSLVYTVATAYGGGVLAPNGDIHFIPRSAAVGQKISASGVVSTYSLVYTANDAYGCGVLAPNGDIHFIPRSTAVGQKISASGVVSTYSLVYTVADAHFGGVLAPNGDIHFVPRNASVGQKISTFPAIPFSQTVCQSPFFNKF